jgi:hypothetical protein
LKGTIEWLLEGEPFIEYRTRVDLLRQSENEPEVIQARKGMISQPGIQSILQELAWNRPKQPQEKGFVVSQERCKTTLYSTTPRARRTLLQLKGFAEMLPGVLSIDFGGI